MKRPFLAPIIVVAIGVVAPASASWIAAPPETNALSVVTSPAVGDDVSSAAVQERRIVAIGDIHGACEEFLAILRVAGLIDDDESWRGGDTVLVQTGDFTDRGPQVRRCIDLLMRLQREAPAAGGEVIVLLGNHEVMNLISAWRDVAPQEYAAFADDDSTRRADEAFADWARISAARARAAGKPEPVLNDELRAAWQAQYPLGYTERMQAFGPDGTYGRWLRTLPTAVRRGDILFMHAGPNPDLADRSPADINKLINNEIAHFDRIKAEMVQRDLITGNAKIEEVVGIARAELDRLAAEYDLLSGGEAPPATASFLDSLELISNVERWNLLDQDGYHWFSGFGTWTDADAGRVAAILDKQGVAHIVAAHMTQPDATIKARFEGRVFLIDTGMLAERYGGRPSALEIVGGGFTAIYQDGSVPLLEGGAGSRLPQEGTGSHRPEGGAELRP